MPVIGATLPNGVEVEVETEPSIASAWVAKDVLAGVTYPHLPFVDDVRVVVDAGSNIGAAAVYFAELYPDAEVHAVEPAPGPRSLLEKNSTGRRITVHPVGLGETDGEFMLYDGAEGASIMGSLHRRPWNSDDGQLVAVRAADQWAKEHFDRIDVLKVDVEGAEVDVLRGLATLLPTAKVVYVEYGSRVLRREVLEILEVTHEFLHGAMLLDQGECVFLRSDLCDMPGVEEYLADRLRSELA